MLSKAYLLLFVFTCPSWAMTWQELENRLENEKKIIVQSELQLKLPYEVSDWQTNDEEDSLSTTLAAPVRESAPEIKEELELLDLNEFEASKQKRSLLTHPLRRGRE